MVAGGAAGAAALARAQYDSASNMTDRLSALTTIVQAWTTDAETVLADFRTRFTGDPLVLDKWLGTVAAAPVEGIIARIGAILDEPDFPRNNPNRLRALMATFGMNNPTQFARADGAGFRFVAEFVGDASTPAIRRWRHGCSQRSASGRASNPNGGRRPRRL